jgi:hypothetical protein
LVYPSWITTVDTNEELFENRICIESVKCVNQCSSIMGHLLPIECKMKFSKEFLQDDGGETIFNEISGKSRWSVEYERIFKFEDKFYRTHYSVGATESQDERPYEYEEDEIECEEVFPHIETVIVYKTTPQ